MEEIERRLRDRIEQNEKSRYAGSVKSQIGSGQRGDKIRTYRLQADEVIDHAEGWRRRWSDVSRGQF